MFVNWKKDKKDVVRFGQNAHTTEKSAKKKTFKNSYAFLGGSITQLLTFELRRGFIRRLQLLVGQNSRLFPSLPSFSVLPAPEAP